MQEDQPPVEGSAAGDAPGSSREQDDTNGHRRSPAPSTVARGSGETRFSRVALITGRPLYWSTSTVSAQEHAKRFGELLEWCLRLPDASLGIDPAGIGLILRSIYAQSGEAPPAHISKQLDSVGATEEQAVTWSKDIERFGEYRDRLLDLMQLAERCKGYAWVEPEDAEWWIRATVESLAMYEKELEENGRLDLSLALVDRHRCTLFAPSDGSDLLESLEDLQQLQDLLGDEGLRSFVEEWQSLPQDVSEHHRDTIYWSWQLFNFARSQGNLANIPLLALWSDPPSSAATWAPPRLANYPRNASLSPDRAASLLEDVLWLKFEPLFKVARTAFGISQAVSEIDEHSVQSPAFYFADLEEPPALPEEYVRDRKPTIYPLVKKCLASDNPLSKEMAWGVLEQDLVALRKEITLGGDHFSCYLLLPVASGSVPDQEIEQELEKDLARVVFPLSFLEFSYADEAPNIYANHVEPIKARQEARQGLWKSTLNGLEDLMAESLNLLPGLGQLNGTEVYEAFEKCRELQVRVEHRLERERAALDEAENMLDVYRKSTEAYLERVTFSPLSHGVHSLRDALLNPFAYSYLGELLRGLRSQMERLSDNIERTKTLQDKVNKELEYADQRVRASLESQTRGLSILFGLLALIGLAQFIPGSAIGSIAPASDPGWPPLAWLENGVRFLILGCVVLLILYAVVLLFRRFFSTHGHRTFGIEVQRLWALAEGSKAFLATGEGPDWAALEREDSKATLLLCKLWEKTEQERGEVETLLRNARLWRSAAKRFWSVRAADWLRNSRYIRYRTDLFALCPNVFPLPRMLCVLRYKSASAFGEDLGEMFSNQDFRSLLQVAGFYDHEIDRLSSWLSGQENQIHRMSVLGFAEALRDRGVTAVPEGRTPAEWEGPLWRPSMVSQDQSRREFFATAGP